MAKKQQSLEQKLGSWTDQAQLTRTPTVTSPAERKTYGVNRSLMERVTDMAQARGISENEVIGRLLTWALDEVASGKHDI